MKVKKKEKLRFKNAVAIFDTNKLWHKEQISLGPFNLVCIHCEALRFLEKRVANKDNSLGNCCLIVQITLPSPRHLDELVWSFIGWQSLSEEIKQIQDLNSHFT